LIFTILEPLIREVVVVHSLKKVVVVVVVRSLKKVVVVVHLRKREEAVHMK
jgi:hypothetical protein